MKDDEEKAVRKEWAKIDRADWDSGNPYSPEWDDDHPWKAGFITWVMVIMWCALLASGIYIFNLLHHLL